MLPTRSRRKGSVNPCFIDVYEIKFSVFKFFTSLVEGQFLRYNAGTLDENAAVVLYLLSLEPKYLYSLI